MSGFHTAMSQSFLIMPGYADTYSCSGGFLSREVGTECFENEEEAVTDNTVFLHYDEYDSCSLFM